MIGIDALASSIEAARPVGIVLLQAVVLYVGYGAVERLVGPKVAEAISGE